jgi:hypothetical protein
MPGHLTVRTFLAGVGIGALLSAFSGASAALSGALYGSSGASADLSGASPALSADLSGALSAGSGARADSSAASSLLVGSAARAAEPPGPDTLPPPPPCPIRFLPVHALEASRARTEAIRAGAVDVGYRTRVRSGILCGSFLESRAGGG